MDRLEETDGRPELIALRALKLGDLLVAVPAIHGLRRAHPDHRFVLAVPGWLEPIVDLIEGVDALLPTPGLDDRLPVAPGRVDIAVNLHGSGPESRRLIDALDANTAMVHRVSEIDGVRGGDPRMPAWRDDVSERERWVRLVRAYGVAADSDDVALLPPARPPVVVGASVLHVGAFYGSRRWPIDRFAAVALELHERGHRIVFTGSAAERDRATAVARTAGLSDESILAGRLDLGEFAAVIERARLVVSADTGAAHLASAYHRPSVVLFGPAAPEHWGPPPGPHAVLTDASRRRGDTFSDSPDPALLAVDVPDVLASVERVLGPSRG